MLTIIAGTAWFGESRQKVQKVGEQRSKRKSLRNAMLTTGGLAKVEKKSKKSGKKGRKKSKKWRRPKKNQLRNAMHCTRFHDRSAVVTSLIAPTAISDVGAGKGRGKRARETSAGNKRGKRARETGAGNERG